MQLTRPQIKAMSQASHVEFIHDNNGSRIELYRDFSDGEREDNPFLPEQGKCTIKTLSVIPDDLHAQYSFSPWRFGNLWVTMVDQLEEDEILTLEWRVDYQPSPDGEVKLDALYVVVDNTSGEKRAYLMGVYAAKEPNTMIHHPDRIKRDKIERFMDGAEE